MIALATALIVLGFLCLVVLQESHRTKTRTKEESNEVND